MLRSTFRQSHLKSLFCIFTCTIAPDRWCFSFSVERLIQSFHLYRDMIKISQTSTCFYFTALEHAALGKIPKTQILYIVLQFSEQAVGHGTERRAAPLSAFPVPHRHSHEDSSEIVLDWALQSNKICKSGLRGRLCFSYLIPPTVISRANENIVL